MESLTVPGNLQSLGPIRDCVRSAGGSAGLEEKAIYRLVMAVDEVAANIVMHGYDEAGLAGMIRLWCEMDADALRVHLEDTGAPYDPAKFQDVDIDQPLETRNEGGLGVFLALRGVDDLQYANGDGTNRHTLVVKRRSGVRPEAEPEIRRAP